MPLRSLIFLQRGVLSALFTLCITSKNVALSYGNNLKHLKLSKLEKFLTAIILCNCLYKLHTVVTIPTEIFCLNKHFKKQNGWLTLYINFIIFSSTLVYKHMTFCNGIKYILIIVENAFQLVKISG